MHYYEIKPNLQKILGKISKKNNALYEQIIKKINEIVNAYDISHYKNLRYSMKDCKRVHIGHFVLVFSLDNVKKIISFLDFDHHDKIYKR